MRYGASFCGLPGGARVKAFFSATFLGLLALSAVAWHISPRNQHEGMTVLVWVSDDNPMRREQMAPFNAEHPEYHVRLDPSNAGVEKVVVQSLGGVGPDLFDCYDPFQLSAYVRAGIAWDVTDELTAMGIDVPRDTWEAVHPCVIFNGRVYGHPTNAAANGIWFHKDLLDAAGLDYPQGPWTWEQFLPIAKALTIRNDVGRVVQYGFLCDWGQNYIQFIWQFGGAMYSDDGTRCTLDSPEAIAALQFMHDLIYKHRVSPSPVEELAMQTQGGWGSGVITLFGGKRAAMAMGGRWWLNNIRTNYKGLQLGAVESPYARNRVFRGYGKATLINKASPNRQAALKFLRYQASETYNQIINDQADGIGPVKRFAYTDRFLHNPQYPQEDYNHVWRTMLEAARSDQVSPFVNGPTVLLIVNRQLDLIRSNNKPVAAAMRDAAREVNQHIQEMIDRDDDLHQLYKQLTARTTEHATTQH
jgi:multiple sugar transport system substrate-binding protein